MSLIVLFNSRRRSSNVIHILLNGSEIQVVKEYKYLGLLLSANGSLKPGINTLAAQANKALFSLMNSAARLKYPSPRILSHLFDSLGRPITEYVSEVWAPSEAEEMKCYIGVSVSLLLIWRFCKFALGLPTSTMRVAVYGDLGTVPLSIRHKVAI